MNTKKVEARKIIKTETITISVDSSSMSSSSSSPNFGLYALIIGLCLVLYTPTWLILLSYKLDDEDDIEDTTSMSTSSSQSLLLYQFISYSILEFIPWFANAMVSIFLACLFLYLGYSNI